MGRRDYLHWVLPLRFVLFELFFALLVLSELRSWALLLLALQSREELVLLLALFVLLEDLLLAFCFPSGLTSLADTIIHREHL